MTKIASQKERTESFDEKSTWCGVSYEDETKKAPQWSRIVPLAIGLVVLGLAGLGVYLLLDQHGVKLRENSPTTIISMEEVSIHNEPSDCYLVIHGGVYDLTTYAPKHPGGPEYVTDFCGMEATRDYSIEHPESLLKTVGNLKVGLVAPTSAPTFSPTVAPTLSPTDEPTMSPTETPTLSPTSTPTAPPTTVAPTLAPSVAPMTLNPTFRPTSTPTTAWQGFMNQFFNSTQNNVTTVVSEPPIATSSPKTSAPTNVPGLRVTPLPTKGPTSPPTQKPTERQTPSPSARPTPLPTPRPTPSPTFRPTPRPMDGSTCFSVAQVSAHNTRDDCWYILYGRVWDFTNYIDRHPGGARRVFEHCGTDATSPYAAEKKHDERLLEKEVPQYEIGTLC